MMTHSDVSWFTPIILFPGIALYLISTGQRYHALSAEIMGLRTGEKELHKKEIGALQTRVLLLSAALKYLYISMLFFCLSAFVNFSYKLISFDYHYVCKRDLSDHRVLIFQ